MGPQEVSSPISCSQHGQPWGQTRLLRAISKSAKDSVKPLWAACSTVWLSSWRTRFSLHLTWIFLVSICASCLLALYSALLWRASVFLMTTCRCWKAAVSSPPSSLPGWTSPAPSGTFSRSTATAPGQLGVLPLNKLQWTLTLYQRPQDERQYFQTPWQFMYTWPRPLSWYLHSHMLLFLFFS